MERKRFITHIGIASMGLHMAALHTLAEQYRVEVVDAENDLGKTQLSSDIRHSTYQYPAPLFIPNLQKVKNLYSKRTGKSNYTKPKKRRKK